MNNIPKLQYMPTNSFYFRCNLNPKVYEFGRWKIAVKKIEHALSEEVKRLLTP